MIASRLVFQSWTGIRRLKATASRSWVQMTVRSQTRAKGEKLETHHTKMMRDQAMGSIPNMGGETQERMR